MYYTEELKLKIVKQVLNKELTQAEASRKYGIKGHSTILKWMKKYGYLSSQPLKEKQIMKNKQQSAEERIRKLEKLLADKELELKDAKLKSKFYETMIDLAEKDLQISIKKNIGLNQSKDLK